MNIKINDNELIAKIKIVANEKVVLPEELVIQILKDALKNVEIKKDTSLSKPIPMKRIF